MLLDIEVVHLQRTHQLIIKLLHVNDLKHLLLDGRLRRLLLLVVLWGILGLRRSLAPSHLLTLPTHSILLPTYQPSL